MITQIGAGDSARPSLVGRVLRWPLWAMPRLALCYILAVELVTLVLMGVTLAHTHITATDFGRFAVLGGLSIFYAEAADRVERVKRSHEHRYRCRDSIDRRRLLHAHTKRHPHRPPPGGRHGALRGEVSRPQPGRHHTSRRPDSPALSDFHAGAERSSDRGP